MLIQVQNFWRKNAIFFSMLFMLLCAFVSRAAFSTATIIFILACCLDRDFLQQIKRWFSTHLLLGMSLLFFIPLISGIWSDNTEEWLKILRVKLPLLLFPLAFAGKWQISRQQWKFVLLMMMVSALAGTAYSFIGYISDAESIHAAYLKAKVISTPFQNDHIRFSLFVSLAFLSALFLVEYGHRTVKLVGAVLAVWFAIYLHILAARTGLLCLYVILLAYIGRILFTKGNAGTRAGLIVIVLALPFIAWFAFPTFQNRLQYFLYDHSFAEKDTYLPGSTDGNRMLSMKAGWTILKENPFGVGAGDVKPAADSWYEKHVPNMLTSDKFYPSSEWLMHGDMGGWPGVLVFTIATLIPFFVKHRFRFFFCLLNIALLISLLFDTGLGVQYGVFLYAFYILAFWKWSDQNTAIADNF